MKDPYIFDMAGAKEAADERDIEQQLVGHITKYLLEMGNGFAFVAKQTFSIFFDLWIMIYDFWFFTTES